MGLAEWWQRWVQWLGGDSTDTAEKKGGQPEQLGGSQQASENCVATSIPSLPWVSCGSRLVTIAIIT